MSTETERWDGVSYIIASRYRVGTLGVLDDQPSTPTYIAEATDISVAHVSRALQELRDNDMVELLVSEDRKKGRIYGLTEKGEGVAEVMTERGEL